MQEILNDNIEAAIVAENDPIELSRKLERLMLKQVY
jgi:hypothetical protein